MTEIVFGRTTPLQSDMIGLGGVVCGVPEDLVSEDLRLECMKRSLESLRSSTGKDFGYDIAAWHEYLLTCGSLTEEYTHSDSWERIRVQVTELFDAPDRIRLVSFIQEMG